MDLHYVVLTDIGRRRSINQDNFTACADCNDSMSSQMELEGTISLHADQWHLFGVFDGIGGGEHGEIAAHTAAQCIASPLSSGSSDPTSEVLIRIQRANDQVFLARSRPDSVIGTTGTVFLTTENQMRFFQVGDSRAYLFHSGILEQCTTDHTLAQMKLSMGCSPDDPILRRDSHVLTRYIGSGEPGQTCGPEVSDWYAVSRKDRILLCSDGLYDVCSDTIMKSVLGQIPDLREAADTLLQYALDEGGPDNITLLLAEYRNR